MARTISNPRASLLRAEYVGTAPAHLSLSTALPGDVVLAHTRGLFGWLVRFGTHSRWSHAALIEAVGATPEQTWVIQAEAKGVTRATLDQVAPGGYYVIVPAPKGLDRQRMVAWARTRVGEEYGYLTVLSIAITLVTPWFLRVDFRRQGSLICSALVALSLHAGGWLAHVGDFYQVSPADLESLLSPSERSPSE